MDVTINGAAGLQGLSAGLKDLVQGEIEKALTKYTKKNLPEMA